MISLWLVAGFLGAGKTSFLKHIAIQRSSEALVFLVNEFATVDIDGSLLSRARPQPQTDPDAGNIESPGPQALCSGVSPVKPHTIKTIPGGSIFCACLVSEFIRHLRQIADEKTQPTTVIIEASGMANPMAIERLLADTRLDRAYSLDLITALVDPGSFLKLLNTLPSVAGQVKAADLVIINKIDLYPEEVLCQIERQIGLINPAASVNRACYGQLSILNGLKGSGVRGLAGALASCRDPHFLSHTLQPANPFDLADLRAGLARFSHAILRLKGYVHTREGSVYLDYSASGLSITPTPGPMDPATLAVVIRAEAEDAVFDFLRQMDTRHC